jgi:hypothetical protein
MEPIRLDKAFNDEDFALWGSFILNIENGDRAIIVDMLGECDLIVVVVSEKTIDRYMEKHGGELGVKCYKVRTLNSGFKDWLVMTRGQDDFLLIE